MLDCCENLRLTLTKLTGASGFASLLSRSLTLARRQAPTLQRLRVGTHGVLEIKSEAGQSPEVPRDAAEGGVMLLAEMLGLLTTIVGEPLMMSLVRQAWPAHTFKSTTNDSALNSEEQQ